MVLYFTDFHTSTLNLTEMWWRSNRILLPTLFSKLSINYFIFQIMKNETKSNEISSPHPFFRMICFRYIFFCRKCSKLSVTFFLIRRALIQIFLIFDNIVAELKITNFLFNLKFFCLSSIFFIRHKCSKSGQKLSMLRRTSLYLAESYSTDRKDRKQSECMYEAARNKWDW